MALKKRDFQKIAQHINDFLCKLSCDEDTADLRDALNLALLYMQKHYKTLRTRSYSNSMSPRDQRSLSGTLLFTHSSGAISPVSPACGVPNQFEWKWINIESPRLSASLGTSEFSSLSPLLCAVKTGDVQSLKKILEQDPEAVNSVDGLGRNGAMYAVYGQTEEHIECLELLARQSQMLLNHQANDDSTALHIAAHKNNTKALSILLQNKVSCNVVDNEGRTALHWASANNSLENLKKLLEHGASMSINDCEGLNPAMWACHFEQFQNLLLLKGALERIDPRKEAIYEETDLKGRNVVHWAVNKTGSTACLEELLTPSSGLFCDREKKNVLHVAAEQGVVAACQLVLDVCGNDCLFTTDNKGRTPLHLAAICGHAEIVNFLLDQGANLFAPDNNGETAVDLIKKKRLHYCMMVLGLNPQFQNLCTSNTGNSECREKDSRYPPSDPSENEVFHSPEIIIDFTNQNSPRRKSEPNPPKPAPRQNRKISDPLSQVITECKDNTKNKEVNVPSEAIASQGEGKENIGPVRRQSLLMRQGGIQEELHLKEDNKTILSLQNRLTSGKDVDDLQTHVGDLDNEDLVINCGNDQEDEEDFAFSGHKVAEERGSPQSVLSEPDHADNCSVSVEISVSSLGSDNDEIVHFDDIEQDMAVDYQSSSQHNRQTTSGSNSFTPHPPHVQPHPPTQAILSTNKVHQSQEQSSKIATSPSHSHIAQSQLPQFNAQLQPLQTQMQLPLTQMTLSQSALTKQAVSLECEQNVSSPTLENNKKKKKKNKNKTKLSSDSEPAISIGPLRGVTAPLEPPMTAKLGQTIDSTSPRPGPWEHASLGILRRGSPDSGHLYDRTNEEDLSSYDQKGNRPWTPEPPRSPRNISNKNYSQQISGGVLANSQNLLRHNDMIKGPQTTKLDSKSNVVSLSRAKSPQHNMFSLHGPVPHPPHK